MRHTFIAESVIPAPVGEVFAFHERPDALQRLLPPFPPAKVVQPPDSLEKGTKVRMNMGLGPLGFAIEAEHVAYRAGEYFEDVMVRGPFPYWHHRHLFEPHPNGCRLRDVVEYEVPGGWLGRLLHPVLVRPMLRALFAYRHAVTRRAVGKQAATA